MRIAIFGSGGVGGYFGGRLAQAGQEVIFIARGDHLRAIREGGLRVDSIKGDFVIRPAQATDDPATIGPVDVVLVAVKAWQVPEAAQAIRPLLGHDTFVVPLQNGVEAADQLAAELGPEHVLDGLCGLISYIAGPGHIRHAGLEPFVRFGERDNRPSERARRLLRAFERAGVAADIPPDIRVATWRKFLLIVSWGGLGAITRTPIGVFRSLPQTRQLLLEVMQEIVTVGRGHGVALPEEIINQTLTFIDDVPPAGLASMQRDLMAGRPSELESQTGAVVRLGQEVGLPTPANRFIYHSLLPTELKARGELSFED